MDAVTAKAWMGLISQRSRLLQIDTPLPDALQVERLRGREAVCEGFRFEVDCISASAFLDLRELLGREVGLRLARPTGQPLHWHGLVTQARRTGADGGLARYRLVLEPWLALLAHRRNALVFQDCDARAVLERVFADYPQANVRFDLSLPLPTRAIRTQFRETDLEFVQRVMAEDGLSWYIEHAAEEAHGRQVRHRLVVFDAQAQCADADPAAVRFHRVDATEASDAITLFSRQFAVVPDSATVASWACDRLEAASATEGRGPSESPGWDVFDGAGARRFDGDEDAARCARARLGALQLPGELYAGEGSVRGLAAGVGFTLLQHQGLGGKRYRPLVVEHEAANNLGARIATLLQATDIERGTYRNRFVCAPAELAPLPLPRVRPTAPGPQTARVVGHADQAITSQRDHQVRIQFPWQRGKAPLAGGLEDAASSATPEGHAPGDQRSGTWVRVAEAVAGPNWGTHFLPRIGSEVLVEFEHGDIDRPVIVGQLYNADIKLPFAAGQGSSANHAGVLSGLRTEGLDGGHPQQWVVDDTDGQLRQRIETTLTDTCLELGHLIDQSGTRRGDCRGSGFELRSRGWGRMHAAGGLLLSTTAREGARSVQMDTRDAQGQLRAAGSTSANVADAATARGVPATAANAAIETLLDHLDPDAGAAYEGPVGGQPSGKPAPGTRDPDAPTERFAQPQLLLEAPSDIALTSAGTMALHASEHISLTCQDDLHLAAAHTIALATGESAGLSAHAGPLRLVAADGPVSLHAHTDALELLADDSVTISSTDDSVEVLAKQRIELRVGNSAITLSGGNVTFACSGRFTAKGAMHPFSGGASATPTLSTLPFEKFNPPARYSQQVIVPGPLPHPFAISARAAVDFQIARTGALAFPASNVSVGDRVFTCQSETDVSIWVSEGDWEFHETVAVESHLETKA
ncbi:type VI secretion system Vgr family protein [Alkalisalibacterium limincola]|uniref:Type VI secretion system tip protein VgrG n=1 Tax=Alkalisalibacterium limincola TaxID=2699169 RepID=A0A5C8KL06_9GAMM|nr:type VI secretion system tip protein TssI/VgrG [Alkalisalibacterium limincola]TXK60977.1 type VI secretion system tip protein VgrG [Alkalisalibacterium limincola]